MGSGSVEALISGIMAARSIINGENYNDLVKPLRDHIENIYAFRDVLDVLDNKVWINSLER
ncbi:hypothetical protein [Desulfotomaculum nigrificans]|uniref:hypothetical protein n=1 Tax=Desulfotomaculum nigrificans TaxID=1565 RepID=UPI0002E4FADC|nr:hypothetical protein [Desulfotomaculum nigrificans]